ncbi:MAG: ABC transporter permease [Planctomycetes bacterium]|nr:ABC transporter permease [Planctomycetota bacterium]
MRRVITIGVREFVETVKTKAFFFSAILMPILVVGMIFGMERFSNLTESETIPTRTVAVLDETGVVATALIVEIDRYNAENPSGRFAIEMIEPDTDDVEALGERVRDGDLYAYVRIPRGAIEDAATCTMGRKDNRIEVLRLFRNIINDALVEHRFQAADPPVDLERIRQLQKRVTLEALDVTTGETSSGSNIAQLLTPFAFLFLLFSGTFGISQGLLTSLIEEKSSRVVEVLLSAVSPLQLLTGKILGTVTVGALLLSVWGSVGYAAAHARGMGFLVSTDRLVYAALYFVPAFLFFASILAAVGSACNTLKEAQSMTFPLSLITIVPMLLWFPISQNPNSTMAVIFSYVPPATPFVMILRVCADPDIPLWQVVTTLALLWACVAATIWCAAKIFRVGVLMYGKPPSLRELATWIRRA